MYTTSDLATMKFRKDELKVDEAVYLTDDRQQN
ncbi:MAG: arginine--tRNA ligase, partial [Olsenella sp.]